MSVNSGIGAFLRVKLCDSDKSVEAWSIEGLEDGAWARGAILEGEVDNQLYVWLGDQSTSDGRKTLRLVPLRPLNVERRTFECFVEALDFWPLFFDYSLEVREGRNGKVEQLEKVLAILPRWQRRFTKFAIETIPQRERVLLNANQQHEQNLVHALRQMHTFSEIVLNLCVDILAHDGLNDIGVYGPLINGESSFTSGPCACGQCELQTHQWVPLCGTRPEAYRHACPCSSAGYDSCRYSVIWKTSPPTARLSESLHLSLALAAPDDCYLMTRAVAVLVRPAHDRKIHGGAVNLLLAPGRSGELTCEVLIPSDIPLGLHEVSIIAILNGSFMQRCYMINIIPAD
ncbi:conserved hypothetical protein [Ricinus communis]|uniref:Uncharacterized protein n=1 Tax=Ricinus communis TaxID=3988 RepID=B9TD36_RICCO|nr:conserved hypothetical protein [Ricinus communis]